MRLRVDSSKNRMAPDIDPIPTPTLPMDRIPLTDTTRTLTDTILDMTNEATTMAVAIMTILLNRGFRARAMCGKPLSATVFWG